jgi:uncharacterized protein YqgV (UPF0045/DUF77 family)
MKISVELSMYPLNEDYKPSITAFIKRLRSYSEVRIETSGMSSQIYGEYDQVMAMIHTEFKTVFEGNDKVSMVMKMVNDDLSGPIKF